VNGNISNGGLLVKFQGQVVFARADEWFLNADDEFIYYSDRADKNRLYRRSANDDRELVVNGSCSGVILTNDRIYYTNEIDMTVYSCEKDGSGSKQCSDIKATEFAVLEDGCLYINPMARRLNVSGGIAYFADAENDFLLTTINMKSGEKESFTDVIPSCINVHSDCIYYTDRMRGNRIYRFKPGIGWLSIFGSSSENLHVINDWLYFISDNKWKKLSLLNFGEAEDV
jgi:hypothetical protein